MNSFSLPSSLHEFFFLSFSLARNYPVIGDKGLGLYVIPIFKYLSKYFAQIYRAQYEAAMLVYLQGAPTCRPENSINIWNLLWLSRQLII